MLLPGMRPPWLDVLLGLAAGFAGQAIIVLGLAASAGFTGPLVDILAPGVVGVIAGFAIRGGWGSVGLAVGIVIAYAVAPAILSTVVEATTVGVVISLAAALLGYAIGYGAAQQAMPGYMPRPPATADLARMEAEVRGQLRTIDPLAPGAFERATVLLRIVNEHASAFGPWSGPRPANEPMGPPSQLLELQAELVETARVAALTAGARRVTITSSGMGGGIDVQAVFGDPIGPEEPLPPTAPGVD